MRLCFIYLTAPCTAAAVLPQTDLSPEAIERARLEELQLEKDVVEPTAVEMRRDGQSALASAQAFARAAAMDVASAPPRSEASAQGSSVFGFGGAGIRGTSVAAIAVVDELEMLIVTHGTDLRLWTVSVLRAGLRCVCGLLTGKKADLIDRLSSSSQFVDKCAAAAAAVTCVANEVVASS